MLQLSLTSSRHHKAFAGLPACVGLGGGCLYQVSDKLGDVWRLRQRQLSRALCVGEVHNGGLLSLHLSDRLALCGRPPEEHLWALCHCGNTQHTTALFYDA